MLVERVERFATEQERKRAYSEINEFEEQLVDHGIVLVKYWIHITKDAQLRRFKEREKQSYKVEADPGRLAQPGTMGRVRARRQRHGRAHEHTPQPVDACRRQRQVFRAAEGDRNRVPQPGGGVVNISSRTRRTSILKFNVQARLHPSRASVGVAAVPESNTAMRCVWAAPLRGPCAARTRRRTVDDGGRPAAPAWAH